ncbi:MAG: hypothetical protein JRH20_05020 [Deltaproteobacteria bacterium]|nr:hypothetical protein [Deltaproteobacteria bacterium]
MKDASAGMVFSYGSGQRCGGVFSLVVDTFLGVDIRCTILETRAPKGNEPTILVVSYDGKAGQVFANGEEVLNETAHLVTSRIYGNKLGAYFMGTNQYFQGEIAEFIGFEKSLSAVERMALESYLSSKFGIPLK